MCSAELDVLFLNRASDCFLFIRNFGNCLALRISLRISLLRFLLKDVKFIQSFFRYFREADNSSYLQSRFGAACNCTLLRISGTRIT